MIGGKRVCVVLPAYQAARTLQRTVEELPRDVVDHVLLVDDASTDDTLAVARALGVPARQHAVNRGYGANQRTCYRWALEEGADVIVMLHPDYQYPPALVPDLARLVAEGGYDVALGSRMLRPGALAGGMPLYKYAANRALTVVENALLGQRLSEYHTGFRAYTRAALTALPLDRFSDGWAFDAELLAWAACARWRIGEIACPTRYADDSSSIGPAAAFGYGLGVLDVSARGRLAMWGWRTGVFA